MSFKFKMRFFSLEKPKLFLDGIVGKKIKVRAGEPINVVIPIAGAPIPKVTWTRGSIPITESPRISVSIYIVCHLPRRRILWRG